MDRLEKLATPALAFAVVVPESVPPPGLVPIATVMLADELDRELADEACTVTCTAGRIAAPAVALVGWTVKATLEAAAGVMLNAAEVAPVSAPEAAVSV